MTDSVRALTCPQCGGSIALRAAGSTVSLVCEHCGTTIDATRDEVKVISAAATAMRVPQIALGTRATVRGVQWEVIGYLERADGWVEWSEYLLFNPYEGYAFLVDDGRRFSLGMLMNSTPGWAWSGIAIGGQNFRRYGDSYDAWVTFVVGEFYWRVAVGETVKATDYVRPGMMISCEEGDGERSWTRLDMLARGEAERAFGIETRPAGYGGTPSPHEPSPYGRLVSEALIVLLAAFVALMLISFAGAGRTRVLAGEVAAPLDAGTRSAVIGSIALPARFNKVTIRANASGLDNAWVDLDYALVEKKSQDSIDSYATAERYRGSDSDGPWSEGDSSPTTTLGAIPAGTYDVLVEASAKKWISSTAPAFWTGDAPPPGQTIPVAVTVDVGGSFVSNVFLALLLVTIWPVVLVFLHLGFEKRRMAPVSEDDE